MIDPISLAESNEGPPMSRIDADLATDSRIALDPGPRIRQLVATMLRLAVGLSLFGAGLARFLRLRLGNQVPGMAMPGSADPFMSGMAFVQIGLGLALILGFLITVAALGSCLVLLATPAYQIFAELTMGSGAANLNEPYLVSVILMLPILMVPSALVLWLSPVANHPWSVDALIFGRARVAAAIRPPAPPSITIGPDRVDVPAGA